MGVFLIKSLPSDLKECLPRSCHQYNPFVEILDTERKLESEDVQVHQAR